MEKENRERKDCLYLVIPAYNEEENIEDVVAAWHPVADRVGGESRLLVVNDGSRDGTEERLRRLRERYPRLEPVTKENGGHGAAVLFGYRLALEKGADYVFQTDSDGQTLAEEFWPLWRDRRRCGLLIGWRKGRQDGFSRVAVTRVLKGVLFFTFRVRTADANTPFRLMRSEELEKVLEKIPEDFHLSNVLMTVLYEKYRLGVFYYPITFRPRQGGKNSINLPRIFAIGRRAARDFSRIARQLRLEEKARET